MQLQKTLKDQPIFWPLNMIEDIKHSDIEKTLQQNNTTSNMGLKRFGLIEKLKKYLQNNPYYRSTCCGGIGNFFLGAFHNIPLSTMKAKIATLALKDLSKNTPIAEVKQKVQWASEYYRKFYIELVIGAKVCIQAINDVGKLDKIFGIKNRLPSSYFSEIDDELPKDNPYFAKPSDNVLVTMNAKQI